MGKAGNYLRQILFNLLSFENYLFVLSQLYFLFFNLGLLRKSRYYEYPYFLKKIVYRGDVVIDIGANLGYLTRLFSKLVKPEGKVYAVEPVQPILNVLRRNTKGLNNVEIYPFALGNENKPVSLGNETRVKRGYVASGSNFILDREITGKKDADVEFEAEMRKGSELFANLNRLDFIKIDVEGYETVIIPEIESLIQQFKPLMLVETRNDNRRYLINYLADRGYKPYELRNDLLHPADEHGHRDILFVSEERTDRISKYLKD